jgi:type IV pilus assembly protein PilF
MIRCLPLILALAAALDGCAGMQGGGEQLSTAYVSNEVADANLRLAVAYLEKRNYEKALEKLERARTADPRYPAVYNTFGVLYQQIGKMELAESNFKNALNLAPDDSSILNNYGQFLCVTNRPQEAMEAFLKASRNPLYETPELALANAGTCLLRSGDQAGAEQYFRNALDLNPRLPSALIQMADIKYQHEDYLAARGYFQRYTEVTRHTPRSLWLGIRIERELGDKNAVSSYALLLRSNFPNSEEAQLLQQAGIR